MKEFFEKIQFYEGIYRHLSVKHSCPRYVISKFNLCSKWLPFHHLKHHIMILQLNNLTKD